MNEQNFESLYWIKHFSFGLVVINVCLVLVPSELLLSSHLPDEIKELPTVASFKTKIKMQLQNL